MFTTPLVKEFVIRILALVNLAEGLSILLRLLYLSGESMIPTHGTGVSVWHQG